MNDDFKTAGLNNPETYVLTHNRFNTYIVLIFTDFKKAQIYKIPYRNSPHQEIEIVMSFDYLHVFGLDENNKDGNFLFEIEDKKYIHVGEELFSLETNDEIEKYFSEQVLTMLNSHLLTVKKTSTSCYIKNIFLFKNMKIRL